MATLSITKGQPFAVWIPTILLNADGKEAVDASTLKNVSVKIKCGCNEDNVTFHAYEHWLVLSIPGNLSSGVYSVAISATLVDRVVSLRIKEGFNIADWDKDSNWEDYIIGDHFELTDAPFITGSFITDADYTRLKLELEAKIAEAEAAKAAAEAEKEALAEKAAALDNVATETNATANKQAILTAIESAKEALLGNDPTATLSALKTAIANIHVDTTGLATEDAATANKKNIKGADSKKTFDGIYNVVGCDFQDNYELAYDDGDYRIINHTQLEIPDVVEEGTIIRASDLEDANLILIKKVNPTILFNVNGNASDGYQLLDNFVQEVIFIEKDKNYICTGTISLSTLGLRPQDRKTGTLYLWAEYDGDSIHDAKEEINGKLGDVEDALEYIEGGGLPSITAIAKQGTNASATLTTTQAAVVDGNDTAISVAKEIRSEVGTGSDTAAESGTLFAVLKWVKDKVKSIFNLIGSPASGQPSTLFAAIAAGGGGGGAAVPEVSVPDSGIAATQELAANTLYIFPNRTSDLTLTLGAPVSGEASEYHFIVEVGSTLPTITLPAGLTWKSSETIAFDTDTTYEVSILDNYAIFVVW